MSLSYNYERSAGENMFKAYQVSHNITIGAMNMDDIGKLLDRVVLVGATDLFGMCFGVQNHRALRITAPKGTAHSKA